MGVRHLIVFLSVMVYTITYITRVDLSNAIIEITNVNSTSTSTVKRYDWSEGTKSRLLSFLFYGYMWLQLPAGYLSDIYGARNIITAATFLIGLTKYFTPLLVSAIDWKGIAVCRFVEGLFQGCILPAVTSITGRWLPTPERIYFNQIVLGGIPFGTTIGSLMSGFLLSTKYGWPFFYYIEGTLCVLFAIIWHILTTSSPEDHPYISDDEKKLIAESLSKTTSADKSKLKVPWLSLMTSWPVIALVVTHTSRNYGYWTFFTQTPRYLSGVANLSIKETGFFSALPMFFACFTVIAFTFINMFLQTRNILSLTIRRKMWITIALGGQGLACLILAVFKPTSVIAITPVLCFAAATNVAIFSGTLANQIDLSPNFGGILMSFTTLLGTFSGIVAPTVVSFVVSDKSSTSQWAVVFAIAAIVSACGDMLYTFFGSAEIQPWNDPEYKR